MKSESPSPPLLFKVCENKVVSKIIDNEAIIIHMETGCYYSLDKTGAEIWDHIAQTSTVPEIVGMLEARYDCDTAEVTRQVEKLLMEFEAEQLIEQLDQRDGPRAKDQQDSQQKKDETVVLFENPKFEKHSDMRDFLLVDPIHQVDDRGWPHKENG